MIYTVFTIVQIKYFTYINSCNPHNHPLINVGSVLSLFLDEESEACKIK